MTSWKLQRLIAGLSRAEVAQGTGITVAQLASIENGVRKPSADEADKLVAILTSPYSLHGSQAKDSSERAR